MPDTGFQVPAGKVGRLASAYMMDPQKKELTFFDDARNSRWSEPPSFAAGGSGLVSTVDDYLAFCRMMLNRGLHGRERILSRPAVGLMMSDQLTPEQRKGAIGAKVDMMMRFSESPEKPQPGMVPPGSENKVMHAAFKVGDTQIMASDGHCAGKPSFQGFALSINAANDAEADKLFNAVGKGGQVQAPLGKTFFASRFGMVTDKFGVLWMVIAE